MIVDGKNLMMQALTLLAGICLDLIASMQLLTHESLNSFKDTYSLKLSSRAGPMAH